MFEAPGMVAGVDCNIATAPRAAFGRGQDFTGKYRKSLKVIPGLDAGYAGGSRLALP